MSPHTGPSPIQTRTSLPTAQSRLGAIADSGFLGVGVPSHLGGHGGHLDDLFRDSTARQWLHSLHFPDLLIFQSQRLVMEALIRTDNIALRELRLPDLLSGTVAGASALESHALEAKTMGLGWQFQDQLQGVPNLQWDGFSLLLPVQAAGQVEGLLLVRSEENGLTVRPSETPALWALAACGDVHFHRTFLRADEWLGDLSLWSSLTLTNQLLRDGLRHIQHQ